MTRTPLQQISAPDLQDWLRSEQPQPLLVDVREAQELEIAPFPFLCFICP